MQRIPDAPSNQTPRNHLSTLHHMSSSQKSVRTPTFKSSAMCHFNHSPCGGERRAWLVGRKGLVPPQAGAPRPQPEAEQEVKLQLALQMNKADAL